MGKSCSKHMDVQACLLRVPKPQQKKGPLLCFLMQLLLQKFSNIYKSREISTTSHFLICKPTTSNSVTLHGLEFKPEVTICSVLQPFVLKTICHHCLWSWKVCQSRRSEKFNFLENVIGPGVNICPYRTNQRPFSIWVWTRVSSSEIGSQKLHINLELASSVP